VGLDLFYADETSPSRAYVKHAKKVCALCPVLVECLDDAYDQESDLPRHRIFGVRAGMAPWERHDLYQSVSGV
jgi:WhiB family redox-sensing transcriptional regulator